MQNELELAEMQQIKKKSTSRYCDNNPLFNFIKDGYHKNNEYLSKLKIVAGYRRKSDQQVIYVGINEDDSKQGIDLSAIISEELGEKYDLIPGLYGQHLSIDKAYVTSKNRRGILPIAHYTLRYKGEQSGNVGLFHEQLAK